MTLTLTLGAVVCEPRVVTVWDGFAQWMAGHGVELRRTLYTSYPQLVDAHMAGHVDVAWNSSLAHLAAEDRAFAQGCHARALMMRDSDRDLRSVIVVRPDSGIHSVAELAGKRVAVGAPDSPQGTIRPLHLLLSAGISVSVSFGDGSVGAHGDMVDGERRAAQDLAEGRVDAACMMDANLLLFALEGVLGGSTPRVVAQSEPYDSHVFTVIAERESAATDRFVDLLAAMDYEEASLRPLLDLEGLRRWVPGRTHGFAQLAMAHSDLRAASWL